MGQICIETWPGNCWKTSQLISCTHGEGRYGLFLALGIAQGWYQGWQVAMPGATLVGPTQSFPTTPLRVSLEGGTDPAPGKWCNQALNGS